MLGDVLRHIGLAEDVPGNSLNALVGASDAGDFGLHDLIGAIRFNTTVLRMERRPGGRPGWRLDLKGPDGGISHQEFDFVAVCTGQFNEPQTLSLPGEDDFKAQGGSILHSSQYNDAALATGRRVVVLGGSKSATDIAVNAVNSGAAEVTLVYREPVWRIPYFIGGLVNFKRILYIRAQEEMFRSWGIGAMSRLAHAYLTSEILLRSGKPLPEDTIEIEGQSNVFKVSHKREGGIFVPHAVAYISPSTGKKSWWKW